MQEIRMSSRDIAKTSTEVIDADEQPLALGSPFKAWNPFFSFHYSVTEWSSEGGRTTVRSQRTTFEDGKLRTERFQGEAPGGVYDSMVEQMQRQVAAQAELMMKSFTWFLPQSVRERIKGG
jgi:hypothetical protein